MRFRCSRTAMIFFVLIFLAFGVALIGPIWFGENALKPGKRNLLMLFALCLALYNIVTAAIYFGKTIDLSKDGCTVKFLFFKKFYPWSHYETKLYQVALGRRAVAISISANIIFLPRFIWKTKSPIFLCQYLYPFSGFCLSFQTERATKLFQADEKTVEALRQWGIQIRGLPSEKTD